MPGDEQPSAPPRNYSGPGAFWYAVLRDFGWPALTAIALGAWSVQADKAARLEREAFRVTVTQLASSVAEVAASVRERCAK